MKVKYVTTVPLRHPVSQFDVSFPEKLLKIVAIRGYIFVLNSPNSVWRPGSARIRWGELKRSPRPLSRNKGAYF